MREYIGRYWHVIVFVAAILVAIQLRIFNPWNSVFTGWTVRLGGNDPWYYYRLIENCIHNFPSRIWFDPFTKYPFGTYIHFGPFLVYLSSIAAMVAGAGDGESVRSVIAFIPVFGGILIIFPIYLLTREVFDKKTAAIASFMIAIIPGQFLQRSMLGFNDHHIWEVFWMVTTLALYMYSVNRWGKSDELKTNILLAALTGISFGLYLDAWAPGFILALILLAMIYLALVFKDYIELPEVILPMTSLVFVFAALVYLPFAFNTPYFDTNRYSPFQLLVLIGVSAITGFLWLMDKNYSKIQSIVRIKESVLLVVVAIFGLILLPTISPQLYSALAGILRVVQPKGGALTIAEVYPFFFTHAGEFTLENALFHFGFAFFFAFPAMIYSIYRVYKTRRFVEFGLVFWAFAMFIALWGQNRFAYYFASVTAIYSAVALNYIFSKLHFYNAMKSLLGNKEKFSYFRVIFAVLIAFALIYPTYSFANMESTSSGGPSKQWYDAMIWLGNNTPDKEKYDEYYYQLYDSPEDARKPYSYPFGTYGVISWWDYGHWIESIAHRMPVANPFQQGIGNKYNNVPGAASFFTAFNESEAESIAEKLNVRYVVSDVEMATGKFYAMAVWAEGDLPPAEKYYYGFTYVTQDGRLGFATSKWDVPPNSAIIPMRNPSSLYYLTMEAKLHIFDGIGLSHYRMIYESEPDSLWLSVLERAKQSGIEINETDVLSIAVNDAINRARYGVSPAFFSQEVLVKYTYLRLYSFQLGIPLPTFMPTGYVKIFERVKGAKITGKAPENTTVELNVTIKTNQNRTFNYVAITKAENGTYQFIVPYAQDTGYDVRPITPYYLKAGETVKTLNVTEMQVLNGEELKIDLT